MLRRRVHRFRSHQPQSVSAYRGGGGTRAVSIALARALFLIFNVKKQGAFMYDVLYSPRSLFVM